MASLNRPQNKQIVDPATNRLALEWDAYFSRLESIANAVVGAGVVSFEGRTGIVTSAAGDYTASEITNVAAGNIAAVTVQAALNELDSEKQALLTLAGGLEFSGATLRALESFVIAASDETTAITATTNKIKFRMPYAFTLTGVKASLSTAQTSGSIFTVDINEAGTTILSTKLTIDNTEQTSVTAATAAVISDTGLAADAEISVDVDLIGDGTAKGLKVVLLGYRP